MLMLIFLQQLAGFIILQGLILHNFPVANKALVL